jgi:hypothetical protein
MVLQEKSEKVDKSPEGAAQGAASVGGTPPKLAGLADSRFLTQKILQVSLSFKSLEFGNLDSKITGVVCTAVHANIAA